MNNAPRKPGDFKADCRIAEWVPLASLTTEQLEAAEAMGRKSLWRKPSFGPQQPCEVIAVECNVEFTDAAAFELHMAETHDRKMGTYQGATGRWTTRYRRQITRASVIRAMWKPPKLTDEGLPWEDKAKDRHRTRQCRGCGLVVEVSRDSDTVIEQHKSECTQREPVAS